jgi:nucleoside-diphosphate-sugar epimerase
MGQPVRESVDMKLALVTGANGFLGRYVAEQLVAAGARVRAFIRNPDDDLARLGVEVVLGDIRDRAAVAAACRDVEEVHHVAGIAGIWGRWRDFYEVNTLGTRHVIEGCQTHGVRRLIYTSSPSVTFDGRDQEGIDELAPYPKRWLCHYPHSKALAEQEVLAANGSQGLATCALRPHLIWGPRDRHLLPRLMDRARKGELRRVGNGRNLIDTVYVENAAHSHLLAAAALAEGRAAGEAYFITQGEPVNCWDWIDELLSLGGLAPVSRRVSISVAWTAGAVLEGLHAVLGLRAEPRMTRFLAAQLGRSHWFDISKARKDLRYDHPVTLEAGMRRLAQDLSSAAEGA